MWGGKRFADDINIYFSPLPADEPAAFSPISGCGRSQFSEQADPGPSLNVRGVFSYQLDFSASHLSCRFTGCCAYKSTYLKKKYLHCTQELFYKSISTKRICTTEGRGNETVRSERIKNTAVG